MKPATALCLALIGTLPLIAQAVSNQVVRLQTAPLPQAQVTLVQIMPQAGACPVSVHAQQAASWNRMEVGSDHPKGPAQRLHLTLANPDSSRITKATVTVRGLTPKTRATPTPLTVGRDRSNAARTLDVPFSSASGKEVSADLWVSGLSAVYTVDLVSLTYADGSTWKLATGQSCRTSIDGFMLIGAR
jgi:hypothetical protein